MKSILPLALLSSALIGVISAAYSSDYSITDLGTLGGNLSASSGINVRGEVTGVSTNSSGRDYAFLYKGYHGTMMLSLGTFAGGGNSLGQGINARGDVTGWATTSSGLQHAFLYNGTTMEDLGVLPGANEQIANSVGQAINARGEVAGTSSDAIDGSPHAFLYKGKTMIDLGTFGGTNSVGLGINDKGEVTGAALTTGNASYHAFLYNGKTMIDLAALLYGADSVGEAINTQSQATGYYVTSGIDHAFLYNGKTIIYLGTLGTSSVGLAINDEGDVVGSSNVAGEGTYAVLFTRGTVLNLNNFISPKDPLYGNVVLNEATGINDLGQIVADGCYANLQCHAFLLTPVIYNPAKNSSFGQ